MESLADFERILDSKPTKDKRSHAINYAYTRVTKPTFAEQVVVRNLSHTEADNYGEDELLRDIRNSLKDRSPDTAIDGHKPSASIKAYSERKLNLISNGRTSDRAAPYHGELIMGMPGADRTAADSVKANMPRWMEKSAYMHKLNKPSDKLADSGIVDRSLSARESADLSRRVTTIGIMQKYGARLDDMSSHESIIGRNFGTGVVTRSASNYTTAELSRDGIHGGLESSGVSHRSSFKASNQRSTRSHALSDISMTSMQDGYDGHRIGRASAAKSSMPTSLMGRVSGDIAKSEFGAANRGAVGAKNMMPVKHSVSDDRQVAHDMAENRGRRAYGELRQGAAISAASDTLKYGVEYADNTGRAVHSSFGIPRTIDDYGEIDIGDYARESANPRATAQQMPHHHLVAMGTQVSSKPLVSTITEFEGHVNPTREQQRLPPTTASMADSTVVGSSGAEITDYRGASSVILTSTNTLNKRGFSGVTYDHVEPLRRKLVDDTGKRGIVQSNATGEYRANIDAIDGSGVYASRSVPAMDYREIAHWRLSADPTGLVPVEQTGVAQNRTQFVRPARRTGTQVFENVALMGS